MFSVDIRWVLFRVELGAIHSRESARNIPAFFRRERPSFAKVRVLPGPSQQLLPDECFPAGHFSNRLCLLTNLGSRHACCPFWPVANHLSGPTTRFVLLRSARTARDRNIFTSQGHGQLLQRPRRAEEGRDSQKSGLASLAPREQST